MHKTKCSKCGESAHVLVNQTPYCLDCAPNSEKMERPRPWPCVPESLGSGYYKVQHQTTQKKKPWYKKVMAFLDDRRPK